MNEFDKGFNRIAFIYDAIAGITSFNQINKSQLAFLPDLSTQSTCLIIGGGTGYFLQKVLEINKSMHITYIEASENMIVLAQKRIYRDMPDALDRVTFVCKRVEDVHLDMYDVVVCNYFLDQFDEFHVNVMLQKYKQCLCDKGLLYITDFTFPDSKKIIGKLTNIGLKCLYRFFKWMTSLAVKQMPDIHGIVINTGFEEIQSKYFFKGILKCSVFMKK